MSSLLIKTIYSQLLYPRPERVFAEFRHQYWVLGGQQTIKQHQSTCIGCQRGRGKPKVPMVADLAPAFLRLFYALFFSTGVDCFEPFVVKIERQHEKCWCLLAKSLKTKCITMELIPSLDIDTFLLAVRRFTSRQGSPSELPD